MKQVKMICFGAGARGMHAYAPYSKLFPEKLKMVAVAEPIEERRLAFAKEYDIPPENVFSDWRDALAAHIDADAVLVATQDRQHVDPACAAMEAGYDVLMEKPVSERPEECARVAQVSHKTGRTAAVCHVLRYTPFFTKLRELIQSGRIGKLMNIVHNENIGWWHMAHSYVRGNWRREEDTSPIILAKSCHDMDILLFLVGADCTRVASLGSLQHFRPENAPEGSAARCLDCKYKDTCAYSAATIYLDMEKTEWPITVITSDISMEGRLKALREGPYGRCVYRCDNDVCDHQSTILEFAGGVTACFNMSAFTDYGSSRTIRIMGTRGEIRANMGTNQIEVMSFETREKELIDVTGVIRNEYAHGGGDFGLIDSFVAMEQDGTPMLSSIDNSVQSHLMCFAAEEARHTNTVVDMKKYLDRFHAAGQE